MRKFVNIMLLIIIFIIAVFIGKYLFDNEKTKDVVINNSANTLVLQDNNKDVEIFNEISVSSVEKEKVSPNATLILKKHYEKCDHTIREYAKMPEEYVNLTQEELLEKQEGWDIEKFSNNEVILVKDIKGVCNEHYVLRPKDGNIAVYKIGDNNEENLIKETEISVEYLTANDKTKLETGIKIYGKEELNSTLEDYE